MRLCLMFFKPVEVHSQLSLQKKACQSGNLGAERKKRLPRELWPEAWGQALAVTKGLLLSWKCMEPEV